MKFLIVNKQDLSVLYSYDADSQNQAAFGGPWGDPNQTIHLQLPDGMVKEAIAIAPDYTITQDDAKRTTYDNEQAAAQTAAVQAAKDAKGLHAQELGRKVIARVFAMNDENFGNGTLTADKFQQLMTDQSVINTREMLRDGSLATASMFLNSSQTVQNFYTTDQITELKALIQSSMADLASFKA